MRRLLPLSVVVLLAALTTPVGAAGPAPGDPLLPGVPSVIPPPGADSTPLDCAAASTRLELTVSSHLDPSCDWTAGFDITASGVTLDCQGATITGTTGRGIEVVTPIDVDLNDVVVRNCRIEGFLNGFRATRTGFRTLEPGEEYDHELADVLLEHNDFSDSRGVGVYVDGYVSRVTIRANRIERAGSTGVYLETGSRRSQVIDNLIHDNGFRENGPNGQIEELGGLRFRWWGAGREGVAVDGSYENVIARNDFEGNSHGGVMLYTNCGEFPDSVPERFFDRRWPADRNLIEDNTFTGGLNGVWVGQRMAENTFPMECAKEPYSTGTLHFITLDFAADNTIRDNHFDGVTYGIRVEDDGTVIEGNTFEADGPDHHAVIVGTSYRTELLDRPVAGTVLVDNTANIAGNPSPYRWVHGFDGFTVSGNTANGDPVGVCEGEPPPRLTLIWVIAAVFEPLGAPPTPPPDDLSHPVLGELAPCTGFTPRIVPGGAEATEGTDGTVRIPVRLSNPTDQTVRVDWDTPDIVFPGIAEVGADIAAAGGVLEFAPGITERFVELTLLDDAEPEAAELAVAWFRNPTNATVGGFWGLGLGLVLDDDAGPPP